MFFVSLMASQVLLASSIDQAIAKPLSERVEDADRWYDEGEYRKARKEYELLARLGSKYGQYKLSLMHLQGQSYRKNTIEAWAWAALAAEHNKGNLKKHADSIWILLTDNEQLLAQTRFAKLVGEYSDRAVTERLKTLSGFRINGERIGRGLLPNSFISVSAPCYDPSAGDQGNGGANAITDGPCSQDQNDNPMARLELLQMINYTMEQRIRGEHVSLGEFEVLENSDGSAIQSDADKHNEDTDN